MAGRRPRSGPGSARSGPTSRPRRAWSATTRAFPAPWQPPGTPGQDILERSPGRWSPSRLGGPPRRVLAVVAALLLAAGAVTAIAAHAGRPGAASLTRPDAQAAALRPACLAFPRRDKRTVSTLRVPDCLPAPNAGRGGLAILRAPICVALPVQARYGALAIRPGPHLRHCYPGMT